MITPIVSPVANNNSRTLLGIIHNLNLTTSLNCVLDAADTRSYDGSSQTWTDATGGGNNFFRGVDATVEATDPTFNGTAGLATESTYFSCGAGDFFQQTAAHTFANDWHKNNGAFTIIAIGYFIAGVDVEPIFDNQGAGSIDGITFRIDGSRKLVLDHSVTAATTEILTSTASVVTSAWNMVAVTFDEATTTASLIINSTVQNFTPTASTSTDAPGGAMFLSIDAAGTGVEGGTRWAGFLFASTKISDANIAAIYSRLKSRRFTSLP